MWKWLGILTMCLGVKAAHACPTCGCGNPTITTMGLDAPYENRLRFGLSTRAWSSSTVGESAEQMRELRFDMSATYAPIRNLQLFLTMPMQLRELMTPNLQRQRGVGPGELDIGARWVFLRDERLMPRYLVSATVGALLPTSPILSDGAGQTLDDDAQLSLGGFTPQLGFSNLSVFSQSWSLLSLVAAEVRLLGRNGIGGPVGLRGMAAAQWQPLLWLAARMGPDLRWESPRWSPSGQDREGTGVSLFAAPDVLFMVGSQLVIQAGVRIPLVTALEGGVRPGPVFALGVLLDV